MNETKSILHIYTHHIPIVQFSIITKANKPKLVIFNLYYIRQLNVEHREKQKKNLSKCHNSIQLLTVIIGFRSPLANNSIFKFDGNTYTFHLEVNPSVCMMLDLASNCITESGMYVHLSCGDGVYASSYAIIKCTHSQFVTSNCFFVACTICPYTFYVLQAHCIDGIYVYGLVHPANTLLECKIYKVSLVFFYPKSIPSLKIDSTLSATRNQFILMCILGLIHF